MEKVINILLVLLLLVSCIFNVILVNRLDKSIDVILETKLSNYETIDTIFFDSLVFDTVFLEKTEIVKLPLIDTLVLTDTVVAVDSVYVALPIEIKHFSDTLVNTAISFDLEGFNCEIDNLYVKNFLSVPTQEKAVKTNRFGLGLQLGIGATKKGFSPYIGVGISYNLFSF